MIAEKAPSPSSYHNAGHAVVAALIEHGRESESCPNAVHSTRWNAEYEAMSALGSVVAERLMLGEVQPTGAANDVANALRHVAILAPIPLEATAYVAWLNARVEVMLAPHTQFIEYVAREIEAAMADPKDVTRANEVARAAVARFAP